MRFIIPHHLHTTLEYLVESFDHEFSLFGKTRVDYDKQEIHLIDIIVPEQDSSGGTTEFDPSALLDELEKRGEDPDDWNMWIHSHVKMGTFWSKTDDETMQSFNRGTTKQFFHMVMSTKGRRACYTQYKPFTMLLDNVTIEIDGEVTNNKKLAKLLAQHKKLIDLVKELAEKIKEEEENDKVSNLALDLEKELDEKNKLPIKTLFNDNSTGEMYDDIMTEKYDVLDKDARYARTLKVKRLCNTHNQQCKCGLCIELMYLNILQSSKKPVDLSTLNKYLYGKHKDYCVCKTCTTGKAINRLQMFQVGTTNEI